MFERPSWDTVRLLPGRAEVTRKIDAHYIQRENLYEEKYLYEEHLNLFCECDCPQ